jgi:tetratricopeptide (TPR) repeat protein
LFNQRAVETLRARLEKMQADLPRLEDRCEDDDWTKATLDLTDYLFWLDESQAWHWLVPRLVESLAYSRELRRGLVQTACGWDECLSAGGKKRLKRLRVADDYDASPEEQADLLDELTHFQSLGYLEGEGELERRAILDWLRGVLLHAREKYAEALAQYERVERELPENGEALKKQLGEALYELADKLMWPQDTGGAVYSAEAERILPKVVAWLPENQGAWYRLAAVLSLAGKDNESLEACQRAIDLDPKYATPHNGIGNVYYQADKYDDALAAYQRAIDLDPKYATPHNGIGNVYRDLGKYDDALACYQRVINLDPKYAHPHNGIGNVYQLLGQHEKALGVYKKAVELAPEGGTYRSSLVGILRKLGRESEAAEQIKIARELMAKENEYNRACFESICGNVDEALALLKVALEKSPGNREWARRDPDFDFIREDARFKALVGG